MIGHFVVILQKTFLYKCGFLSSSSGPHHLLIIVVTTLTYPWLLTLLILTEIDGIKNETYFNLSKSESNKTIFNVYSRNTKHNKNVPVDIRCSSKLRHHSANVKTWRNSDQTETTTYSPETDSNEIRRIAQNKLSVGTAFSSSTRKLHRSTQSHRHGLRLLIIDTRKLVMMADGNLAQLLPQNFRSRGTYKKLDNTLNRFDTHHRC